MIIQFKPGPLNKMTHLMIQQQDQPLDSRASFVKQLSFPPKVPISIFPEVLNPDGVPATIIQPLTQINFILNTMFTNFDVNQCKNYKFKFPSSVFSAANFDEQVIEFKPMQRIEEDTFNSKLTPEQLENIRRDGTFLVPSKLSKIPYKWKIHHIIFKGYEVKLNDWYVNLSRAYHQFRQVGKRLNGQTLSIKLNLSELILYPRRMFNMFVGAKQMKFKIQVDYDRIMEIGFLLTKFQKFYGSQNNGLYEHLFSSILYGYDSSQAKAKRKKIEKFQKIDGDFDSIWDSVQRQDTYDYKKNTPEPNEEEFRGILINKKKQLYDKHLSKSLDETVKENVFDLLRMFTIFQVLREKLNTQLNKTRQNVQNKLMQKHKIRSKSHYFMDQNIRKQMEPIEKSLREQYQTNLKKQLKSQLYFQFLTYRKTYAEQKQKLQKRIPHLYQPARTFTSFYQVFPPYKVIESKSNGTTYYHLQKTIQTSMSTDHHFWKFSLYKMRLVNWTKNSFFWLVALVWVGPLGIKQLLTFGQFIRDQYIPNSTKNQIHYEKAKSLYLQFMTVLEGIKRSREAFERLPDTGLFGKNLTRILNYIECYVFRFLIVGVILLLIVKPIAIIAYCILSVFLVFTIWIWLPLSLVITYLFNVLIYQFELDEERSRNYRTSQKFFPIINTPLMLVLNLVRVAVYTLSMLIIHPIGMLFWIIFAFIARLYRTVTDNVMFVILKSLARTPSRQTAVAWKVSGPGLSRHYYNSMGPQDVYLLVQAELEKKFIAQYAYLVKHEIRDPINHISQVVSSTFSRFSCSYRVPERVQKPNNLLNESFQKQYQRYLNRLPSIRIYNVRFSKQELDFYFENSIRLVKSFIEKNKAQWMLRNSKYEQKLDEFTKKIWTHIFGDSIFQALEDLDSRFEQVKSKSENSARKAVFRALEGEVNLQKFVPSASKSLKKFEVGNIPLVTVSFVAHLVSDQSSNNFRNSINQQNYSILFNRNIRQIIQQEKINERYDRYYAPGEEVVQKVEKKDKDNKKYS